MSDETTPPTPPPGNRPGSGQRDAKGRFVDGTGNLSGRPKDVHGIGKLAREHAPWVITRLLVLAKGRGAPAVAACKELLDRGLGKAPQSIDVGLHRTDGAALAGSPDAARRRIEELIAKAAQQREVTAEASMAPNLESGSPAALPPSETEESAAGDRAPSGHHPPIALPPGAPQSIDDDDLERLPDDDDMLDGGTL
jgi:hypothetical protein